MPLSGPQKILDGITVLDCTVAMAGPFAAQRLGDIGADVIKIEPVTGEWQRQMPAGGAGKTTINASFLSLGIIVGATSLGSQIGSYFTKLGTAVAAWSVTQ